MAAVKIRVLLVDDEIDFLTSLSRRLSLRDFEVLTAQNGRDALDILDVETVDIVVLDFRMPGMNGIQVLEEVKKRHPQIEVILLTGHADLEASLEGMKLGFFDYLTKPIGIDKLIAKIRSAIGRNREDEKETGARTFDGKMKERMITTDRLASIGTLAAGIAHEINNPLAIISEAAGWLKSRTAREASLPQPLRDSFNLALEKIETSIDRARRISRGLLNFARETDSMVSETNLLDMMQEIEVLTRKAASGAGVEVSVASDVDQNVIWVDPYQLRQVMLNLVTNALQAVGPGGRVNLNVTGDENMVQLIVRDNGPGIAPENMERIFEPFFTTKSAEQGTGLGLSVSRSIIEALGGEIKVESRLGVGSTFRVILPRRPPSLPS